MTVLTPVLTNFFIISLMREVYKNRLKTVISSLVVGLMSLKLECSLDFLTVKNKGMPEGIPSRLR